MTQRTDPFTPVRERPFSFRVQRLARSRAAQGVVRASALCALFATMTCAQGTLPLNGRDAGTPPPAAQNAVRSVSPTENAVPDDYRMDTGDLVQVEVSRHPDVSRTLRLPADARLRLPRLVSPILVRGKTCAELTDEVHQKLTTEGKLRLRPGQVTVAVIEMRVRRVFVRGTAGRNGDFDLKNDWRISELVTVAGGIANSERVTARLTNPKRGGIIKVDLYAALNQPESAANISLQEGDTLTLDLPRNKRLLVKGEGPRGMHELDERFGLRQALTQLGFSTSNASGDLRAAKLFRHAIPGDPNSPTTATRVDLFALMNQEETPDIPLQDLDTLEIKPSDRFIYIFGETGGPRRWYMPEDRPVYLADVMAMSATGSTKLNDVRIMRADPNAKAIATVSYKFGDFLKNGNPKNNPEIQPKDMIVLPYVTRSDETITKVWQSWGLYGIAASLFPGLRIR